MEKVRTENMSPSLEIQDTSPPINIKRKGKSVKCLPKSSKETRKKIRAASPPSSKYSLSDVTLIERTSNLVKDEEAMQNSLNMSTSHGPNFNCSYCDTNFYSGIKLKIHLLMEHMVGNCMICDLLFMNEEQRAEHERKFHNTNICEICHGSFDEIVEHYKKGHDAVVCNYCNVLLHPSEYYFKHIIESHCVKEEFVKTENLEDIGESRREFSAFFCKLCEKYRPRELLGHYSYYHRINIYYLAKVFKKKGLDLKLSNLEVDDNPKIKNKISCNVCSAVYTEQVPKFFHKVFCEGYTSCPYCPEVFEIPEALDKHVTEVHKPQNTIEACPLCDETYTEEHLVSHNATQLKPYLLESDFSCSLCSLTLRCSDIEEIVTHFKNEHSVSTIKILNLIGSRPPSQSSDSDSDSDSQSKTEVEYRKIFNPIYVRLYFDPKTLSLEENPISCEFCFENLPNKLKLLGHYYDEHNFKIPECLSDCSHCNVEAEDFSMETHLKHFLEEQSSKTFECIKCYFKIGSDGARKHILEVHGDSLDAFNKVEWGLRCKFCKESFWEEEEADRHETENHLDEETKHVFLKCFRCERTFNNLSSLQKHNPAPSSTLEADPDCKSFLEFAYHCTICNRTFPSQTLLRDHFLTIHPRLTVVFCPNVNCKTTFTRSFYAKSHFTFMHDSQTRRMEPSSYECNTCGKSFANRKGYLSHLKNSQRGFKCVICGEKFHKPEFRKHHYRTVHPEELRYQCTKCKNSFATKYGLHNHIRTHSEVFNVCSYCGKEFSRRDSYKEHLLIHIGPKNRCPYCPKFFTQKSNLRRHVRLHTGEKPYSCPHCLKKFSDKGACNSHVTVHSYQAECFCGRKFSNQEKLEGHKKRCTGKVQLVHNCGTCNERFTNRKVLRKHEMTHKTNYRVGKSNYQCLLCKSYFSIRCTITRHLKNIHKIPPKEYSKHIRRLEKSYKIEDDQDNNEEDENKDDSDEESDENKEAFLYPQDLELQTKSIEFIKTEVLDETIEEDEALEGKWDMTRRVRDWTQDIESQTKLNDFVKTEVIDDTNKKDKEELEGKRTQNLESQTEPKNIVKTEVVDDTKEKDIDLDGNRQITRRLCHRRQDLKLQTKSIEFIKTEVLDETIEKNEKSWTQDLESQSKPKDFVKTEVINDIEKDKEELEGNERQTTRRLRRRKQDLESQTKPEDIVKTEVIDDTNEKDKEELEGKQEMPRRLRRRTRLEMDETNEKNEELEGKRDVTRRLRRRT